MCQVHSNETAELIKTIARALGRLVLRARANEYSISVPCLRHIVESMRKVHRTCQKRQQNRAFLNFYQSKQLAFVLTHLFQVVNIQIGNSARQRV